MNMKKYAAFACILLILLSLTACGGASAETPSPFVNMDAVDLDGNQITSEAFAGNKLTMVNLWNLGCSACIMEIPDLDRLNDDLAQQGVAVMGLYYNNGREISEEDRAAIADILQGTDYPHIVPSAEMMKTKQLEQVSLFPQTFFVDSEGNIVDTVAGSRDYEGWIQVINKQLKKVESNG